MGMFVSQVALVTGTVLLCSACNTWSVTFWQLIILFWQMGFANMGIVNKGRLGSISHIGDEGAHKMVSGLFLSPLPDLGAGIIMALLGLAIGGAVLLFLGIAFLEGVILIFMDWPSILTALFDSFLANLATTILGILAWWFTSSVFYDDIFLSPGMWFVMWGVSMAIEGGLLQLIRRQPAQKTWTAAFIMNIVSYAGLYKLYTFGS